MENESKTLFRLLALTAGLLVIGFLFGFVIGRNKRPVFEPEIQMDTLIRIDTIKVVEPKETASVPKGYELVKVGTIRDLKKRIQDLENDSELWAVNPDTVFISIPLEVTQKTYTGDDYKAVVSGIHPRLDEISVFPKTVTITTKETVVKEVPPKWTISPFAGVDIGHETFAARAGVLADYQLKGNFRAFLGGGYEIRDDVMNRGWFATGGVSYQIHP